MKFRLYKISGYEDAIMALRMSKGKFYSAKIARNVQELVYLVTDQRGFICNKYSYERKLPTLESYNHSTGEAMNNKITGDYETDIEEFKRLLGLTMNNAMGDFKHHTLMKYLEISFFTEGLHRGAQDDLDAHAIAFNNRITRFSTRLAEINEDNYKLSEWYQDKIIPIHDLFGDSGLLPEKVEFEGEIYWYTPFGYMLERFADMSQKSGLYKDVARGGMALGLASNALWKIDIANLRYVYKMRSKLTKANPELKNGMEQLADQIEEHLPVFGELFRKELTDTGVWEHMNKVRTISADEYKEYKLLKRKEIANEE